MIIYDKLLILKLTLKQNKKINNPTSYKTKHRHFRWNYCYYITWKHLNH